MTEPKQWAIEQHIKKNPKCEWLCTHTKLENLGEQPEDRPITEPTIDTLYQKITDICFENGGATKPMVDKLYKLISDQVAKARIDGIREYADALIDLFVNPPAELGAAEDMHLHPWQIKNMILESLNHLDELKGDNK